MYFYCYEETVSFHACSIVVLILLIAPEILMSEGLNIATQLDHFSQYAALARCSFHFKISSVKVAHCPLFSPFSLNLFTTRFVFCLISLFLPSLKPSLFAATIMIPPPAFIRRFSLCCYTRTRPQCEAAWKGTLANRSRSIQASTRWQLKGHKWPSNSAIQRDKSIGTSKRQTRERSSSPM